MKKSADEGAKWSGAEGEVLETKEEADNAGGTRGGSGTRTATAWDT